MAYIAVSKPTFSAPSVDLGALLRAAVDAYQIRKTHRVLHALSDRELRDIGLVRADIEKVGLAGRPRR